MRLTREDRENMILALQEKLNREARRDLLRFTFATMPTFAPASFHRRYYSILNDFAKGEIKKLMVFMPPQHGKSEGSTRRLPAYLMGINPDTRLAIVSYSSTKAKKFNREIQRIIDTPEYHEIFPDTNLGMSQFGTDTGKGYIRTTEEFEIVGHRGSVKTVGVGGALTGEPVDVLIMDDIYKDAKTAWSEIVRESVSDWYDTVAETRLHNDSRQLMVFTRWHEQDLAGKLLKEQGVYDEITNPNGWQVVIFEAIKTTAPTEYDPREEGEALWPERHSREKLEAIRDRNPHVFGSLYQQDPKPAEGLMYERGFRTYSAIPGEIYEKRKNYPDTADEGADFLCSINYIETPNAMYVTDVLFTTKPMEYTEVKTAEMLTRQRIEWANIESNNGGRCFARNVEKNCRAYGNTKTVFHWFHQSDNKAVRIYQCSNEAQNLIYMPEGWEHLWPEFYNQVTYYMKVGKNAHDDAPDALSGMVEHFENRNGNARLVDEYEDEDDIYN